MQMELDPRESVDGNLVFCPHLYDRMEISYMRDHLGADATFVDIGANVGFYSLMAAKTIRTGRIIAIEPAPATYAVLQRNIALNTVAVTALQCGVSDRDETLELRLQETGNRGMSSFLPRIGAEARTVAVPCHSLLRILQEAHVESVAGLKIDVEGFEYKILKHFFDHAPRALYPQFVITEFHAWERGDQITGNQIELLESVGYQEVRRAAYNRIFAAAGSWSR
jgi:FkbM family methyltransferase